MKPSDYAELCQWGLLYINEQEAPGMLYRHIAGHLRQWERMMAPKHPAEAWSLRTLLDSLQRPEAF